MANHMVGYCSGCGTSTVEVVLTERNLDAYLCKDCLFKRAVDGAFDGGILKCAYEGSGEQCDDNAMYCESHGSECQDCTDPALYCDDHRGGSSECDVCGNYAEYCGEHANRRCSNCGDGMSDGVCSNCRECSECGDDLVYPGGAICGSCATDNERTSQIPFVVGDDGNATVEGMEVRWS